jgi:predicted GIY-YIG superfamily endonuclease
LREADERTYLYRCFDQYGTLLYAGITGDIAQRMSDHAKDKFWWGDVVKTSHQAFETREQALWAEWAVISTCHPLHNRSVRPPGAHRCPPPPPPPLPIEGYIYTLQALAKIEDNAEAYQRMDEELDDMIAGLHDSGPGVSLAVQMSGLRVKPPSNNT